MPIRFTSPSDAGALRKSARPSSVSLTVTRSRARAPEMERDEHARQHVQRLAARRDERTGHPAVRVRALPEARQVALEAGQVLEVRRGRDEQRVDPVSSHALGEPRRGGPAYSVSGRCAVIMAVSLIGGVSGSRKKQARRCARRRGRSAAGTSAEQRSNTYGQRGWKRQPLGGRAGSGTSPGSASGRKPAPSAWGIAAMSASVYGCCGAPRARASAPISTTSPRYMTPTASAT